MIMGIIAQLVIILLLKNVAKSSHLLMEIKSPEIEVLRLFRSLSIIEKRTLDLCVLLFIIFLQFACLAFLISEL